jgi:ankyrin repeat protein
MGKSQIREFHNAVACGNNERVVALLSSSKLRKKLLASVDDQGNPPLHVASAAGHTAVVQTLLSHHYPVNEMDKQHWTPLHCAAHNKHLDACLLLLQCNADPAVVSGSQNNIFHFLSRIATPTDHEREQLLTILKCVVNSNADINAENKQGESPLHQAAFRGHLVSLRFLLDNGAEVDHRSRCVSNVQIDQHDLSLSLSLSLSLAYTHTYKYYTHIGSDSNTHRLGHSIRHTLCCLFSHCTSIATHSFHITLLYFNYFNYYYNNNYYYYHYFFCDYCRRNHHLAYITQQNTLSMTNAV